MKHSQTYSELCIYCGSQSAVDKDHVPPKLLFPKPRPADLVTVPSCRSCNGGAGKDEEYFLAILMFSQAGISPVGHSLWSQKLRRMYSKNLGLRAKIVRAVKQTEVITPAGLLIGKRAIIKFDVPRFEKVAAKMVKGLYFFEYSETLPHSATIESVLVKTEQEKSTMTDSSPISACSLKSLCCRT